MPKQQLAINRFEGGLVTDPNDRDLGENQFSVLKGFSVDSLGGIKMIGGFATHAIGDYTADDSMTFKSGLGLFAFSSDRDPGGAEAATNYLASTNGDYIHIYDDVDDSWNFEDEDNTFIHDDDGFSITGERTPDADASNHIYSFYAPDGNLRVSDGYFANHNHTTKLLKYISAKTYGQGDNKVYPTTLAQVDVGGKWTVGEASIEHGLDSNHLKMINLGGIAKGVMEGNSIDDTSNDAAADFIKADGIVGNVITVTNANYDHGINNAADDFYNGMTCSLFKADCSTIYGVVYNYDYNSTGSGNAESAFSVWTGPGGDVSPATAVAASAVPGDDEEWSFQVGQSDGYLWNSDLNKSSKARGVISADYGVTLTFSEGAANTGSWMTTTNTRYKFYHSTTFDASTGDIKQQESSPSLFTMYGPKNAAGTTSHVNTDEMHFSDSDTWSGLADNADAVAASGLAINFGLIIRLKSDNDPTSFTDATCDYQDDPTIAHDDDDGKISVGMTVSGTGIPLGAYVASVTSDTAFELSASTTGGSVTNGTLTFNAGNFTIGSSTYESAVQDNTSIANGTYDFLAQGTSTTADGNGNERVTGGRIYWASSEDGFNSLNLLMDYDLEKGMRPIGSGSGASTIGGYSKWKSWVYPVASNPVLVADITGESSTWYAPPILETYETINGYRHDAKLDAKWKTAVIANNRVYAANVKRKEKSIFDSLGFTESCTTNTSNSTVTHTASTNIRVGMRVSGTGIPINSYVSSVADSENFQVSIRPTADATNTLTFIGNGWNVNEEDDPSFQDRIIKSPVGKYDTFPADSAGYIVEGFNSSDGDEIIKLETYADRILAFKKYRLQIWNTQKGAEFLESELLYNGLDGGNPAQACATDFGIAWMNSKGVYFYDGQKVQSLTDNVIRDLWVNSGGGYSDKFWLSSTSDVPIIGFDPDSKKLFCLKTSAAGGSLDETCLIYSFKTKSWTTLADGSTIDNNVAKRFGHYKGQLIYDNRTRIKSWNDGIIVGEASGQQAFTTKDIDFGAPGIRKKIYKVYITYKCNTHTDATCDYNNDPTIAHDDDDGAIQKGMLVTGTGTGIAAYVDSITSDTSFELSHSTTGGSVTNGTLTFNGTTNIQVKYGVNGESTQTKTFRDGTNFTSNELLPGTDWIIAELKPSTLSQTNNIYSFQLALTCDSRVPAQFEIDDITIVYRVKSIK